MHATLIFLAPIHPLYKFSSCTSNLINNKFSFQITKESCVKKKSYGKLHVKQKKIVLIDIEVIFLYIKNQRHKSFLNFLDNLIGRTLRCESCLPFNKALVTKKNVRCRLHIYEKVQDKIRAKYSVKAHLFIWL